MIPQRDMSFKMPNLEVPTKLIPDTSILISNLKHSPVKNPIINRKDSTDWKGIVEEYSKRRPANADNLLYIHNKLREANLGDLQIKAIMGSIMEESGGDPLAISPDKKYYGLLQWEKTRYDRSQDSALTAKQILDKQISHIISTINNTSDKVSWTHGGVGSGYKKGIEAKDTFFNSNSFYNVIHALNRGYIRPTGKNNSVENRFKAGEMIDEYTTPKTFPYRTAEPEKLLTPDDFYMKSIKWKSGGKFGFNKSRLVKNAEAQNKRDMRKKFIKSDRPTYTKPLVKKKQEGGSISNSMGDIAMGMIPVVGTYQDYKKFRENPTWGNFGWMAASAVGDALFLTGAGAVLKGIKLARAAAKSKALLTANRYSRSQKGFQRGLEYGASKGDVKSMFQNLRNYKTAEQKQLAAEEASRQQIIGGIKKIGKDLGQDSIINAVQEATSESRGGSLIPVYKKQKGGIMQGVMGNLNTYSTFGGDIANAAVIAENGIKLPEIKFNPDLFTSWNSIQTNVIETPYVDYQSKFPRVDNLMSKINSTTPSKSDTPAEEREVKILPFKFDAPSTVTSFVNPYKGKRGSWVNDMKQAYRDAGIKNENAIRMLIAQDALESRWGEAVQGAYNFGNLTTGKSWKGQFVKGRDKDATGNPISQKFRSYGSTKDYAADKIDFLKRLYDFDENDNIDTFLHKLQGGNKGGRSYAEDKRYKESVLNTYNSFKG